jgi:hypothetical protein
MATGKMIKNIKWKYEKTGKEFDVSVEVDLKRFEKQFTDAQFKLDSAVMTDMIPYMPRVTGTFINVTKAMSAAIAGTGEVVAAAPPYGRFLYEGKVMVDPKTGSPWARKGAKKTVTNREIRYSNPKATAKWFDTAKKNHSDEWVKLVKKHAGGD